LLFFVVVVVVVVVVVDVYCFAVVLVVVVPRLNFVHMLLILTLKRHLTANQSIPHPTLEPLEA